MKSPTILLLTPKAMATSSRRADWDMCCLTHVCCFLNITGPVAREQGRMG